LLVELAGADAVEAGEVGVEDDTESFDDADEGDDGAEFGFVVHTTYASSGCKSSVRRREVLREAQDPPRQAQPVWAIPRRA
jgi:hypothetical protein